MKDLRGKNAIVTGSSRGLGVHIARTLAQHGVHVVLTARNADKLDTTRTMCAALGVKAIAVAADVTSIDDQRRLVATAERELGSVDILINNAGLELVSAFTDMSVEQIDEVIRTNLNAPIWLTKLVLPSMLARRSGSIVQVASLAGKAPVPYDSIYATTKAGLINFASSLCAELDGTGVTSSVVCPGFVSDAGMWADREAAGAKRPFTLGTVSPQKVANAVIKAAQGHPEMIVAATPMRPLLALGDLSAHFRVRVPRILGLTKAMRREAALLGQGAERGKGARTEAESTPAGVPD